MADVNRMADPLRPASAQEIDLLDPELMECPYPAYEVLREQAPVWHDPKSGFYLVTRYEDLRAILMDTASYSSERRKEDEQVNRARAECAHALYREKGWVPEPTLALRDDPGHAQLRTLFDETFRAGRIREIEPFVRDLAYRLVDAFPQEGRCEFVRAFAIPFPLIIIGRQMGVPEADIWRIKAWTDAWVNRTGLMQRSDEEFVASVEAEIEAQHYFQPMFERLRREPDDSLLSDLVNREVPGWGRTLTDAELHAEMMADTFVGGAETTTNALSAGIMLLAENREVWRILKADPESHLRAFIEEVLRLESPVQSRLRTATKDISLHGVRIPKGAQINIRYAAANRDPRRFAAPEKLDLTRRNAATHMAFGSGSHHCLGAPLARRELHWGFLAFLHCFRDFTVTADNSFRHNPNFWLRSMRELHITYEREPDFHAPREISA